MSDNSESSSDEERIFEYDQEYNYKESSEEEALTAEDHRLFDAVWNNAANAAEAVQQAIRDGANVNAVRTDIDWTPLMNACEHGNDRIVGTLLDAGADARWRNSDDSSAITIACYHGHLSTVQLLINHDNGLLESVDDDWRTPVFEAVEQQHYDIVRFLLDSGAKAQPVDRSGITALMIACERGSLESVRLLMAAGAGVGARDEREQTALHYAARRGHIEVVRELILQHNANMSVVDYYGETPLDCIRSNAAVNPLLAIYGNKLTQNHGRLALHAIVRSVEYSFDEDDAWLQFHPPLNPLRIILPLGKLTLTHLSTLLHTLDHELIRNRDDSGKLPMHVACQTNAPVEVLALILELDPTALGVADFTGALPIHLLCGTAPATEYASVPYLVEQGGVGTLAARDRLGLLPLHVLCGSTNPPLRVVQYLIQSFPGSVAVHTNAGQYPFMVAACELSSASLSVIYELVRASSNLVVPR